MGSFDHPFWCGSFKGGETPFEFDIKEMLKADGENLLAVRVLNPTNEPIDGIILGHVPHRNKNEVASAGGDFNHGGIKEPVDLRALTPVYITNLFIQPEMNSGLIRIKATVRNSGAKKTVGVVNYAVALTNGKNRFNAMGY